jgi:hypothetical protein
MTKFSSIFSQLLPLFRDSFREAVVATRAERHARGFRSWDQFVAMLFGQLGGAHSLREITLGLSSCEGKLNHLGMKKSPARSTLAYANENRPHEMFEHLFNALVKRIEDECRQRGLLKKNKRLRFKNPLVSLDASVIELCAEVFDWATFRRTKGAVKLHLKLNHEGYLPAFAVITEGAEHEINQARVMSFAPGTIVVFDRGYLDYEWYYRIGQGGAFFVTRLKKNAVYKVVSRRALPQRSHILADDEIVFEGSSGVKCPQVLRRVVVWDAVNQKEIALLTNHLDFGATTVAAIYKDRWQVELFFRALKQNLQVKTFLGTSANALKTQLWTALIAVLILRYLQLRAQFGWSLSNLSALLRMNLFVHRNLWEWLDKPFAPPPELPEAVQLKLGFASG